MIASIMSAPAGLMMAKIVLPEMENPPSEELTTLLKEERTTRNVMDAAAEGATEGLRLALNVAAMLVAFVALLAMINYPLAALSEWGPIADWRVAHGVPVLKLQVILGYILTPLAWCMGVPWDDCLKFGSVLGQGVVATEFVAYLDLSNHIKNGTMSPRAIQIATYALCGFANLPSIAIQIGGLSGMAPSRRSDFATLGLKAMTAGALACWMTGAIASLFIA
jgi:CNT family concentrative nucleoside transporter